MLKKIKNMIVVAASVFTLSAPMLVPVAAHAAIDANGNAVTAGICEGVGAAINKEGDTTTNNCADDGGENGAKASLQNIVRTIINIFSFVVGIVSVIMIILGGFKYITSGGESSKVTGAKSTIMYAIIGLVIVALAQVIVRYVLTNIPA